MDAVRLLTSLMGSNATGGNVLGSLMGASGGGSAGGLGALAGMLGGSGGSSGMTSMLSGLMGGGGGASSAAGLAGMLGGLAGGGGSGNSAADMLSGLLGDGDNIEITEVELSEEDEALLYVRAMCNAAKSDGKIDQQEMEVIVSRLGDVDETEAAYVKQHLQGPVNLADFTEGVPARMRPQVYAVSVMGMNLDTQEEAQHLASVAQALQLTPDACNQIHAQLGAPQIFK